MGEGDLVNFHPAKKSRVSSSCINSFFFFCLFRLLFGGLKIFDYLFFLFFKMCM